jgi:nucleoside-diphosphate-sugar epimerase
MHIFIAGAAGAVGRPLTTLLVEHGHTVTGTTRSRARADEIRALGAEPVVVDGLDRDGLIAAVGDARPDAVVHEMTAISDLSSPRHIDRAFALTNRLRIEGTDNLLAAARAAGVQRVVAQSFAGWPAARTGGPVKNEADPPDPSPPEKLRAMLDAILYLEAAITEAGGVALRYGGLYGPGTSVEPGGEQWEAVAARKMPLVGDGGGVWSFLHVEDAASATLAALERWTPGEVYNVVDDDPAPVREWLPALASIVGAKPPRHVPRWAARMLVGEHAVAMMCETRGASNAKIRRELGWQPGRPSWRQGFAELAAPARARVAA